MRNRIPPPILTLMSVALIALISHFSPSVSLAFPVLKILAFLCFAFGIVVIVWAAFLFKKQQTTVNPFRPNKTSSIVASGPYKFTRNPMYLSMLLLIISSGLWFHHWSMIPVAFLFWLYMSYEQIKPEELALIEKFGTDYSDYMTKVRRWI